MLTLLKENLVNQSIPDQGTLTNSINIYRDGKISEIKVSVNITHPYIGDISLKLTSPSGTEVFLRNRQGGFEDDLHTSWDNDMLTAFHGESTKGLWTLTADDNAEKDSGTLDSWEIAMSADEFNDYPSEIFIPDNQGEDNALLSTQVSRFKGKVTEIEAFVHIEHTFISDLIVSIVAPSGKEIVVHNREGSNNNDIKTTYNTDKLEGFIGENTEGNWMLKVRDFAGGDAGKVKHWKLKFRFESVDDLKKIEGIGPKIEQLLHGGGIYTFTTLAVTPVEKIKAILEAAGPRYQMHNPATWGEQASLAALGKWDELAVLQEVLDGGKVVA